MNPEADVEPPHPEPELQLARLILRFRCGPPDLHELPEDSREVGGASARLDVHAGQRGVDRRFCCDAK